MDAKYYFNESVLFNFTTLFIISVYIFLFLFKYFIKKN